MTTPRITVATLADLAQVVELLGAQLREHDIPATQIGMEKAVRGMLDDPRRGTIFLAWEGASAIGLAALINCRIWSKNGSHALLPCLSASLWQGVTHNSASRLGEPCWIRTSDLLIKSQLLYRLS